MSCCCNCNPCLQYPCCNPITTTTIPVPPIVTCEEVAACVKTDLQDLVAGQVNAIDNFCDASVKCVNDALGEIPLGNPSGLGNLNQAVFSVLRSLPGYTNSGNIVLSSSNGVMQWLPQQESGGETTTVAVEFVYYGISLEDPTTPLESEILSGSSIVGNGELDVSLNWGTPNGVAKYYWFAIKAGSTNRNKNFFYESPLNNSTIGGPAYLFGAPSTVMVNGQSYNVWITNYLTEFTANNYIFSRV